MVPAYEADRALGEAVDGHTREAKRVRRLIATMAIHWGARRGPALAGGRCDDLPLHCLPDR